MVELRNDELMEIDGGAISVLGASLIVLGVIFVAGIATGILESYSENK